MKARTERSGKQHRPVIEYCYQVDGAQYEGNTLHFFPFRDDGTEEWAESVAREYVHGKECEVHYDAANPGNSALRMDAGDFWVMPTLTTFMGLACFWTGGCWFRCWRRLHFNSC